MKLKGKILISIIAGIIFIASAIYGSVTMFRGAQNDGHVSITVIDYDGNEIASKNVGFNEGDTFVDVLTKSGLGFEFSEAHPEFGVQVLVIKGVPLGETHWWSHSINGTMSEFGVSSQPFKDGDSFIFQILSWMD